VTACPDEGTIQSFVEATLPKTELPAVEDHVADCTTCRQLVAALRTASAELASGTAPTIAAPPVLATGTAPTVADTSSASLQAPPTQIGRYQIVELIGAGGMGLVFEAKDPELRRRIAIKLLRGRDDDLGQRLIREARAMAEIQHPNVVAVYDVGKHGDHEVYVAMELVRGGNLRRWQTAQQRSEREILDAYQQAGRGLAAAHAVGLVHRDFKPDNVLIGDDGRIRVTDFGLARRGGSEDAPASRASRSSLPQLTLTGALNGTPGYVAPEQYAHGTFDARSDQFAFCVAVWEALAGNRPFRGSTLEGIEQATLAGEISEPGIPIRPAIRKILERGLAIDPAARWSSIDELLAALDGTQSRGKRRALIAGITLTAVAIAGIATVVALRRRAPEPEVFEVRLAAEASELSQRVLGGDREGAAKRADEILARAKGTDDYATALSLRGFVHYALGEYAKAEPVLVEAVNLAEAAGDRRTKAIALGQLVNALEELGKTEDAKRWQGMVVASARRQASVTLGHALNADANRKWHAGKRDEALASYRDGAEVWALTGDLSGWAANRDLLATNLLGALEYAPACALVKSTLATLDATPRQLADRAQLEAAVVEASIAGTGAQCELGRGDPKAAIPYAERAVAATLRQFGEQSTYLDTPLTSLAQAYEALGDFAASEKTYARALALPGNEIEKLTRLGMMTVGAVNANRLPLAVSRAEQLVARSAKVYPPDHLDHLTYRVLLGKLLVKSKQLDRSRALFEEVLPLVEKQTDPLMLADVRAYLARSLGATDVNRARELAALARTAYVAAGSQRAPHLELLDEFLATLPK
jgi:tetratricopeptide (TPR) repeat protein